VKRVALFAALLLVVGSCSKQGTSYLIPDTLRIALPISPNQLNPLLAENTSESFLAGLMFSELVTVDAQGRDVPDLAAVVPTVANGGIGNNGLTLTYHLRRNAKWQDGVPVTSKDVVFTWHAIMNPNNNVVSHRGYDQIASMTTPDDRTVIMHMKRLFAPAIDTIFGESDTPFRILPAHLLARYPNINTLAFNSAPIGSGPYTFVAWRRGDSITLKANPLYYLGKPKIDTLIVKIINDQNTTEAQVRSHEIDLALEISGTNYQSLADDPDIVRLITRGPSYTALFFNTQRPPLDDVRVRRAIALGINRAQITSDDTYGTGEVAVADLSRYYWAFDPSLSPLPYDPKEAGLLLDQAGWRMGADGIRYKNGSPLALQLAFGNGSQLARTVIVQAQQMLKQIGVDLSLKGYDYSQLYASKQTGGIYTSGKFDIALYAWIAGADPDNSSTWLSSMTPPTGNNITLYKSAEMDAAQTQALSTFDRAARTKAYALIEALLLRDVPGTFIYYQGLRYAYVPQLKNFAPNGVSEGWNAYEWNI
jgi:peptide/nickel transport system substrate-binding protein